MAGYRPAPTVRALQQLVAQGIVRQDDGKYELGNDQLGEVLAALRVVNPWLQAQTESFYEIARDAAKIILTNSWAEARVEDVLLYGSTLRSESPRDIDLVIFHRGGHKLAEFEKSEYAAEAGKAIDAQPIPDLPSDDVTTTRLDSYRTLSKLGYKIGLDDNVVRLIGDRIATLDAGSVSEEGVASALRIWEPELTEFTIGARLDIHGIAHIFDVHVMHTGLLDQSGSYTPYRDEAIHSCRDPTFWHRVLSEGRLYDRTTHDFSLGIEDKYPGALKLFEVQSA